MRIAVLTELLKTLVGKDLLTPAMFATRSSELFMR
jgi:hypothetical protein